MQGCIKFPFPPRGGEEIFQAVGWEEGSFEVHFSFFVVDLSLFEDDLMPFEVYLSFFDIILAFLRFISAFWGLHIMFHWGRKPSWEWGRKSSKWKLYTPLSYF